MVPCGIQPLCGTGGSVIDHRRRPRVSSRTSRSRTDECPPRAQRRPCQGWPAVRLGSYRMVQSGSENAYGFLDWRTVPWMSSKEPAKYPVKSLAKALRLLEFLGRP